jgi:hypothetical protein
MISAKKLTEQLLQYRAERASRPPKPRQQRPAPLGVDPDPFTVTRWRVVAGPDPGYLPKTRMREGQSGFHIACRGCGGEFESKGLAYCSSCLALPAEDRRAMHPVTTGRRCQAPGCEKFLPRTARAGAKYCSKACGERARYHRSSLADNPDRLLDTTPPENLGR